MLKSTLTVLVLFGAFTLQAQEYSNLKPEDTEYYKPKPPVVRLSDNLVPDDAFVLFDGQNLDQWKSEKEPENSAPWLVEGDEFVVKPGTGDIRTKKEFGDFQLHLEWKSPEVIKGEGQGRGNSGVFLQGLYEIQVLDNDDNPTYVNGQAGSLYKQRPPLVEVRSPESGWHTYDILFTAPHFDKNGQLVRKGAVTVLHNGVVVQNNTQIDGTTEYIGLPQIKPHGKGPIILQDHGDLVRFRNIWIREL